MPRARPFARKGTGLYPTRKRTREEQDRELAKRKKAEKERLKYTYSVVHFKDLIWPEDWRSKDLAGRLDVLHDRITRNIYVDMDIMNTSSVSDFQSHRKVFAIVSGTDLSEWHHSNVTISLCLQTLIAATQRGSIRISDRLWKRWALNMDFEFHGATFAGSRSPCRNWLRGFIDTTREAERQMLELHLHDVKGHTLCRPAGYASAPVWSLPSDTEDSSDGSSNADSDDKNDEGTTSGADSDNESDVDSKDNGEDTEKQ
jgi:hypothetical protein